MKHKIIAAMLIATIPNAALAGVVVPQPFQIGDETARFDQGIPVVTLEREHGAVQITPVPMDHGSVAFTVVVFNDGDRPANFGIENVSALAGEQRLSPFSADTLADKARTRAVWSQIGIAVLAGAAAGLASQAHTNNRYRSTLRTPHGTYRYSSTYRDNSIGVLGATAAVAGGVVGVKTIQDQLNLTLREIGDEVVQTTTVDPGESYGGRIVLGKITGRNAVRDVRVTISWNGENYEFGLHVPKRGDPAVTPVRSSVATSRTPRIAAEPVIAIVAQAAAPAGPAPEAAGAAVPVAAPK